MTTTEVRPAEGTYALGRSPEEYERLRAQARVWEAATGRLLDQVGLAQGARCLDAGCGPGETMRLMAARVGPTGEVTGIDIDAELGVHAQAMLHEAGHRHSRVLAHDLTVDEPVPGGPYDLIFARLLLFHLPQRVGVLRRLWDAVAPGGHLVVQEYDLRTVSATPPLRSVDEVVRVMTAAFLAAGCDIHIGGHLSDLFGMAGVGTPDGADVAGRVDYLVATRGMLEQVFRSVLPVAVASGITTQADAGTILAALQADALRHPERSTMWPLLVAAWAHKRLT